MKPKANVMAWIFLAAALLGPRQGYSATTKAYKGADLPKEQLAVVYPDRQKTGVMAYQTVQFFQVDDVPVGGVLKGWPKKVEVPAGEHTIVFRFFNSKQSSGAGPAGMVLQGGVIGGAKTVRAVQGLKEKNTITFTAAAGHEYVFKFSPLFTPERFWIEDKADGRVAGELKPESIDLNSVQE